MNSKMFANPNIAEKDYDKPLFPISTLADILNVHQRTLRIYDEEEILVPKRNSKNRRLYTYKDVEKGMFIQLLGRELGINIAGIKIITQILENMNIDPKEYRSYVAEISESIGFTEEIKKENVEKKLRRGRKPSKDVT